MNNSQDPTTSTPGVQPPRRRVSAVTLFTFGLISMCILGALLICVALIYSSQPM